MSDGYTCFETTLDGGVATVTLSRGDQLNTMVPAFWDELPALVRELDATGEARVVVLAAFLDSAPLGAEANNPNTAAAPGRPTCCSMSARSRLAT